MKEIMKNLYQFSVYIPSMDFTIHQYLLNRTPAILFAAGTEHQAKSIIPQLKKKLGPKPLKYIFVSHMESDEAGGLSVLHAQWPDVTVICSELAARELPGFGYTGKIAAEHGGNELRDGDLNLVFFDYPSEVHLQNGLLCLDKNTGILYSADLFQRFGDGAGKTLNAHWTDEITEIDAERISNPEMLHRLRNELLKMTPAFVAVGHGFCLKTKHAFD